MGLAHKAPTLGGGKALAALGIVTAGLEFVAVVALFAVIWDAVAAAFHACATLPRTEEGRFNGTVGRAPVARVQIAIIALFSTFDD